MGRMYISNNLGKVKQVVSGFKGGRICRRDLKWVKDGQKDKPKIRLEKK